MMMCSAFTPDCRYDNSFINFFGNVSCPNTIFPDKLCVHRKGFQSLGTSYHQCPNFTSLCQVRNIPFEGQTYSFYLKFGQGVHILEEAQKSTQDVIADVDCPTCPNEKCVYLLTNKNSSFCDCKK